jgi:hypothetical protein
MIKIDLKRFVLERAWFGWWYRDRLMPTNMPFCMQRYYTVEWVRDRNPKTHWRILKRNLD